MAQNLFFTGKVAFLFKILRFQQPLRSYRLYLINSTKFARIPCGPLSIVPRHLSCSMQREKIGQIFSPLERLPFFKKKICVFNKLIGPKGLILLLRQYLPEYLLDPHKLFPEACHSR